MAAGINVLPVTTNFVSPAPVQQGSHATVVTSTSIQINDGTVLSSYAGLYIALLTGVNAGVYDIVSVPDSTHVIVSGPLTVSSVPVGWNIGDSEDLQAQLPQPLQRDLKYRAFERAYTAVLNDPNSLLFNSPVNRIAFPHLQRTLTTVFVNYEPTTLPENDPVAPWNRVGVGNVSIVSYDLVVTPLPLPVGNYIYWNRSIDLTFPHVFAAAWENTISSTPTTQGVFTGVAFGYSDNQKAVIVGYLLDGTTAKVGFLKKGSGNNPSQITAWIGGLDSIASMPSAMVRWPPRRIWAPFTQSRSAAPTQRRALWKSTYAASSAGRIGTRRSGTSQVVADSAGPTALPAGLK